MKNELMRYAAGEVAPRRDRAVVGRAKQVHDEVRLAALKADGLMALAGHLMEGAVALDEKRRALAENDPAMNMLLSDIEATAIRQLKSVQRGLLNDWGF